MLLISTPAFAILVPLCLYCKGWMKSMPVPGRSVLTGHFSPSAFYGLSLQSHYLPAFFVEANDIVFHSRSVMLYPVYPRLPIS